MASDAKQSISAPASGAGAAAPAVIKLGFALTLHFENGTRRAANMWMEAGAPEVEFVTYALRSADRDMGRVTKLDTVMCAATRGGVPMGGDEWGAHLAPAFLLGRNGSYSFVGTGADATYWRGVRDGALAALELAARWHAERMAADLVTAARQAEAAKAQSAAIASFVAASQAAKALTNIRQAGSS